MYKARKKQGHQDINKSLARQFRNRRSGRKAFSVEVSYSSAIGLCLRRFVQEGNANGAEDFSARSFIKSKCRQVRVVGSLHRKAGCHVCPTQNFGGAALPRSTSSATFAPLCCPLGLGQAMVLCIEVPAFGPWQADRSPKCSSVTLSFFPLNLN